MGQQQQQGAAVPPPSSQHLQQQQVYQGATVPPASPQHLQQKQQSFATGFNAPQLPQQLLQQRDQTQPVSSDVSCTVETKVSEPWVASSANVPAAATPTRYVTVTTTTHQRRSERY